ncbi:UBA3 [Symbiodinium sp. CCMP2592]|nr:UBA3 [Symbiodinium sp. CCMP2592]
MAAFLGGVVAQEVVKFTGKYTPLHQFLYLDMFELCPASEPPDWKPLGSRYDDQIAIFGSAIQQASDEVSEFRLRCGVTL